MNGSRLVQWDSGSLRWPTDTGTIIDQIGNTPIYRLKRREPIAPGAEIWAKLENVNPGGSIKDRTAAMMMIDGIARNELRNGKTPDGGTRYLSTRMFEDPELKMPVALQT